jgi:hypothetical protein
MAGPGGTHDCRRSRMILLTREVTNIDNGQMTFNFSSRSVGKRARASAHKIDRRQGEVCESSYAESHLTIVCP